MSELDDLLAEERARRDADAEIYRLQRDHGQGFEACPVHPDIESLVEDLRQRLPPDAGSPAYWVKRNDRVTVHLPPEPVGLFSGVSKEYRAEVKHRTKLWRTERQGDARILEQGVPVNDSGDKLFHFIEVEGEWSAARPLSGLNSWESSYELQPWANAKSALIAILRRIQK